MLDTGAVRQPGSSRALANIARVVGSLSRAFRRPGRRRPTRASLWWPGIDDQRLLRDVGIDPSPRRDLETWLARLLEHRR